MAEYTVHLTMIVSTGVTVEADDVDAAIDAAYHSPDMPGSMGHQAPDVASVDGSGWLPASVSDAAGEQVWSEGGDPPAIDPAALPEPDRWIPATGWSTLVPVWNSDVQNVIAWHHGVDALPGGFHAHVDDLERYALAIIAAVRYGRRPVAVSADGVE